MSASSARDKKHHTKKYSHSKSPEREHSETSMGYKHQHDARRFSPPHRRGSYSKSPHRRQRSRSRSPKMHQPKRSKSKSPEFRQRMRSSFDRVGLVKKSAVSDSSSSSEQHQSTSTCQSETPKDEACLQTDQKLTPEQKLELALATARAATLAVGPKMPTYLSPGAVNPDKFRSNQDKRKLLWGKKKEGQSTNNWEKVSFGDEEGGGATQLKFRRLMGIGGGAVGKGDSDKEGEGEVQKKHTETLNDLEQQYELSRFMTHMAKGAGLGYGSSCLTSERKVDATNTDEM